MRNKTRARSLLVGVLVFLSSLVTVARAQQLSGDAPQKPLGDSAPAVLRITTREVLVDVVATDHRNRTVRDLTEQEIEVVEVGAGGQRAPIAIASFRPVDAAMEDAQPAPQSGGFRVSLGGDCAARNTFHYAISFHPDEQGWQSGYHEIAVSTTRKGIKLAYHNRYYVGVREALDKLPSVKEVAAELESAACYHPSVPPSIGVSSRPIATDLKGTLRYFITIDADSLKFTSASFGNQRVQLDYGACTFDAEGRLLRYFSSEADRMLSSSEYAQATVHGFPNLLEFPRIDKAAMMRVAVRDRMTGNIGITTIALTLPDKKIEKAAVDMTHDEETVEKVALAQMELRERFAATRSYFPPPPGPIGSFGSIFPKADSFCGDVYDLPKDTVTLPVYWNLSSIGGLYASSLDVPHQIFNDSRGIPGITPNTAWFGVDYHATFWVKNGGEYDFRLLVDDGAMLWIDDQKVIDMDGIHAGQMSSGSIKLDVGEHSMHVPYLQGPPSSVGLALAVKKPGEKAFRIFDLREFAASDGKPESAAIVK